MITPQLHSASQTWAPGGIAYLDGKLYFAGLRGKSLYVVDISNGQITEPKKYFENKYGRIRDVVIGPNNTLYIATSNQDGRGDPIELDDRIIRINPKKL